MKTFKPGFLPQSNNNQLLKITPLGGVGDVTKNMYVYEYKDDIVIVDCGVGFPSESMPGVDLVIPDIGYLRDKIDKIRGIVITHGHDDHIGGLPYIWPELQVPIYASRLTCAFIKNKFNEAGLPKEKIVEVKIDQKLSLGNFQLSFYIVSHSIPDSMGIVLQAGDTRVIHQADFKIDWTPVSGQVTDVGEVARLGKEGVDLLLIDCLRVEKEGFNKSEKSIEDTFEKASIETEGKLLITMTSSNVSRMQQAINVALRTDRKIVVAGRSFESNFQISRDLGYLKVPAGLVVASDAITHHNSRKLLILIAGSQGQPGSALSRAAMGEHKQVKLKDGDAVLFSADPIPSTESAQSALIDDLTRIGVNVYYSAITSDLHVSGHAAKEELRLMINLIKPKNLLPIGGTFKHMRVFSKMAQDMGYAQNEVLLVEDGQLVTLDHGQAKLGGLVEVQNVYVDGLGVGDIGSVVLRDRQKLSEEGIVVVVIEVDAHTGKLTAEPELISKGFVFEQTAGGILDEAKEVLRSEINKHAHKTADWRFLRKLVEDCLEKFFYHATERRPLVLPVIVES